jgi:hypothetical protein
MTGELITSRSSELHQRRRRRQAMAPLDWPTQLGGANEPEPADGDDEDEQSVYSWSDVLSSDSSIPWNDEAQLPGGQRESEGASDVPWLDENEPEFSESEDENAEDIDYEPDDSVLPGDPPLHHPVVEAQQPAAQPVVDVQSDEEDFNEALERILWVPQSDRIRWVRGNEPLDDDVVRIPNAYRDRAFREHGRAGNATFNQVINLVVRALERDRNLNQRDVVRRVVRMLQASGRLFFEPVGLGWQEMPNPFQYTMRRVHSQRGNNRRNARNRRHDRARN